MFRTKPLSMENPRTALNDKQPSRFRRWLIAPIVSQLKKGTDPERISWAVSLGIVTGLFPILGTPSLVCLLAGWVFKLNHAILQTFKELTYPLHLMSILLFIHAGQKLFGEQLIEFSIPQLMEKFKHSPSDFFHDFGLAALQAALVWAIIAPFLAILIKWLVRPIVVRLSVALAF